ncbi:hypothetical protein FHX42_002864 [Saccharopolyspora lacisalsi]|uniref:Uncharacterized protein n=1 Tax=Halosaccharopolyspora lacisalsi TaxID=1000566 RepID=A0A839DWV5_9PSEU|nr:hypothetical protein [Halosaccharopolyspora lacisalsi]MBA8825513.1 hypothetical protein [Halosaccharopolyspora lacisalsi]
MDKYFDLEGCVYPATRDLGIEQPVVVGGRLVTFWESVSDEEEFVPLEEVARLIRWLPELARSRVPSTGRGWPMRRTRADRPRRFCDRTA